MEYGNHFVQASTCKIQDNSHFMNKLTEAYSRHVASWNLANTDSDSDAFSAKPLHEPIQISVKF